MKEFTKSYEIHYYEVDSKLRCKLSSIIDFICDVGTQQSESVGGGIEYCTQNNCAWVFYKYDIKMSRYPMFGETINITTRPVGFKKFYGLREYIIRDSENSVIGEALALFFLIDIEKRRPTRIKKEQYEFYGVDGDINYDISMEKLECANQEDYSIDFKVRYSDIDSNNHVNNVKYIEWAIESVPVEIVKDYTIKRIKVTFEKESKYGEIISSSASIEEIDDDFIKTYHTIRKTDGTELTLLEAEWQKESNN